MKFILSLLKRHWAVLIIFFIALFIRCYDKNHNFDFEYDQGRDFTRIYEMQKLGDLKLVGPETDIPGVFNGSLYYYFLLFLSLISNSNVVAVLYGFALINSLICILLYKFSLDFFEDKFLGIVSALLWAISFEQIHFSKFLSNASMMIPTSVIFFIGLAYAFLKRKPWGLLLSGMGYALAIHMNFYLVYLGVFYIVFYTLFRTNIPLRWWFATVCTSVSLLSPFFIAEYKWRMMGTRSLLKYFNAQIYSDHIAKGNYITSLTQKIVDGAQRYESRVADIVTLSYLEMGRHFAFILFVIGILIFWHRFVKASDGSSKNVALFTIVWIFSSLPLFYFSSGVLNGHVINTTIFFPATIIAASAVAGIFRRICFLSDKYASILVILALIVVSISQFRKNDYSSFAVFLNTPISYGDLQHSIEYMYESSKGEKFEVCALTNPLFVNSTWSFAFKYFGEAKHGYLPYWTGQPQILNRNFLPTHDSAHAIPTKYLILEPPVGMKAFMKPVTTYLENINTNVVEEKTIGNIVIQKRVPRKHARSNSEKMDVFEDIISKDPRYSCNHHYE